jgi:hypothetical protein
VANTFTGVNGFTSLLYAILTVGFFGAGLSYLVAPVPMLQAVFGGSVASAGPESIVLWQLIGIGLSTIVAPACLSLKVGVWDSVMADVAKVVWQMVVLTRSTMWHMKKGGIAWLVGLRNAVPKVDAAGSVWRQLGICWAKVGLYR